MGCFKTKNQQKVLKTRIRNSINQIFTHTIPKVYRKFIKRAEKCAELEEQFYVFFCGFIISR